MSQSRDRLDELCAAAWALAVAAAWADGDPPPGLQAPMRDVLVAAELDPDDLGGELLRADLRSTLLQTSDFFARARAGALGGGWAHTDPEILQAQGTMSSAAVPFLADQLFPMLGLTARLNDFLDVGTGVGAVAIGLAQRFPELRVVGLEPQDAPLALARQNVAAAGLEDRIELRQALVQDIDEDSAFDVVWLPLTFLPAEVVGRALERLHRALRPGGWIVTGTLGGDGGDLRSAAARLRAVLWGGEPLEPAEVERMARAAGFAEVRTATRTGSGLTPMALGRN